VSTPILDPAAGLRGSPHEPVAPATAPERRVPFDRLFNVRDLGGYRGHGGATVRWRTLYRADALERAAMSSVADAERLGALGLRTVVDLRTDREVAARPPWPRPDDGIDRYHHPVLGATWDEQGRVPAGEGTDAAAAFLAERYCEMLDEGAGAIGSVLALLTDPDGLPLAFHCSVGKDRTGVVAAVVLSLLGVDDAVIAHDYGLSRFGMAELLAWLELELPDAHAALLAHPPAYLDAPPSAIRHLLGEIRRRWGTIEGFADSLYLDERAIARIRSNLLVEI
jgi:protein tyrosine/serine phosphatase